MFVSVLSYWSRRQPNTSNVLKILFNFGQFVRASGNFGLYMTPRIATFTQCLGLQYYLSIGNVIARISLSTFLLWRLRQMRNVHSYGIDKWISIVLFVIKVTLAVSFHL